MHIIITGDPISGFGFVGPFEDAPAAIFYAEGHSASLGPQWWIAPVDEPEDMVSAAEPIVTIALTRLQVQECRQLALNAVEYTDDATQQDYLKAIANRIESRLIESDDSGQIVLEIECADAYMLKSLIYQEISTAPTINRSDFLNTLIDQFEQSME